MRKQKKKVKNKKVEMKIKGSNKKKKKKKKKGDINLANKCFVLNFLYLNNYFLSVFLLTGTMMCNRFHQIVSLFLEDIKFFNHYFIFSQ